MRIKSYSNLMQEYFEKKVLYVHTYIGRNVSDHVRSVQKIIILFCDFIYEYFI